MAESLNGCVAAAKGPIAQTEAAPPSASTKEERSVRMTAKVGKAAPDFEASAFFQGGFKNIKLSDYKGQWLVLCFYPGDFTFV